MALPKPGKIALRAVEDMIKNCADPAKGDNSGVVEVGGNNRGPSVEIYQKSVGIGPGDPWCAAVVYFRLSTAAIWLHASLPSWVPRSGYTPDWKNAAIKAGTWIAGADVRAGKILPQRGDLVLFWKKVGGVWRIGHIGFVVEADTNGFTAAEGNTSPGAGFERDGGGCFVKRYHGYSAVGEKGGFIRSPCNARVPGQTKRPCRFVGRGFSFPAPPTSWLARPPWPRGPSARAFAPT